MIDRKEIESLVEEKIAGTDIFIVEIKIGSGNNIKVTLDSTNGISIEKCVGVSRHIERNLDREKEDFQLQVSSPGLDQPLKVFKQYEKNIDKKVSITTTSGEKYKGILKSVSKEQVVIEAEKKEKIKGQKKSKKYTEEEIIPFQDIKETKIVIDI